MRSSGVRPVAGRGCADSFQSVAAPACRYARLAGGDRWGCPGPQSVGIACKRGVDRERVIRPFSAADSSFAGFRLVRFGRMPSSGWARLGRSLRIAAVRLRSGILYRECDAESVRRHSDLGVQVPPAAFPGPVRFESSLFSFRFRIECMTASFPGPVGLRNRKVPFEKGTFRWDGYAQPRAAHKRRPEPEIPKGFRYMRFRFLNFPPARRLRWLLRCVRSPLRRLPAIRRRSARCGRSRTTAECFGWHSGRGCSCRSPSP